jgi:ATP-dependent DNA helicase RecG
MDILELRERILKGEDLHTEFKERITDNEDLAKSIVGFANTDGGQIILGVSDDGDIIGVENVDETIRRIDDVAYNRCEPPISVIIETVIDNDKTVIIINVPKGDQRPYRTSSGNYYIRSANRFRLASREELLRLFQATESIYYDETTIYKATLKDLDNDAFRLFMKEYMNIEVSEEMLINYMKNLKILSKDEKPTLAGILFFGSNPQLFIPTAKVVGAYIQGADISTPPLDKKEISGRIPQIIEDTMRFLKIYVKEEHRIKGLEPEAYPEIPDVALREAIVNAVAHRDYTISAPIRVFVFNDRIEFHTPGKLPNTVTIDSMKVGGAHVLRNPTIYNLLLKMGLVTDIGSGVKRIIEVIRKNLNKEVDLFETENEFVLTIPRA